MRKNSVKISIFYQMLYEVLALSLPLVTSPYISRTLGAENIGVYSYTYSIATYFGMFSMLGVKNHGNREIAKTKDDKKMASRTFCSIYAIQLVVSCFVIALYTIYILSAKEYRLYFVIQLLYVLSYMLDINWFFFGMEMFKQTSVRNMVIKIATFVATIVFVKEPGDLWKYCVVMAGGTLVSELILWIYVSRYVNIQMPSLCDVKKNIKPMLILFIPVLATSIYTFMDKIMVGSFSTKVQLGYYENSEKITNCVKTAIISIGTVMMPRMSSLVAKKDNEQLDRYMRLSIELIMFLAFAFAFGIASVADVFAPVYWGNEFSSCGVLLVGLSVALPFSAFGNFIRTQYMIPHNMDREYIVAVLLSAVVNAVLNAVLIPRFGAAGAVAGTVMAESGVCIIQSLYVRKFLGIWPYVKRAIPYLIFGIIMYAGVKVTTLLFGNNIAGLLGEIITGAVIYVILCLIYIYVTKNEVLEVAAKKCRVRKP